MRSASTSPITPGVTPGKMSANTSPVKPESIPIDLPLSQAKLINVQQAPKHNRKILRKVAKSR